MKCVKRNTSALSVFNTTGVRALAGVALFNVNDNYLSKSVRRNPSCRQPAPPVKPDACEVAAQPA